MPQFIKLYNSKTFNKDLNFQQSVVLSYIIDLSQQKKYCYASNKALADKIGCSEKAVKTAIAKLKELEIIYTTMPNQGRRIYLNNQYTHLLVTEQIKEQSEASKKRAYAQAMSHKTKNERIKLLEQTVTEQSREIRELKAEMDIIKAHLTLHGIQIGTLEHTQ